MPLAAGDTHVTADGWLLMAPVDDEIVALGFSRDTLNDGLLDQIIALGSPKRGAKVGFILLAKAHIHLAGACNAYPVTALAEIMGQGRDEAEPSACFLNAHIAGGTAGTIRKIGQAPALLEIGTQLWTREGIDRCDRRRSRQAAWFRSGSNRSPHHRTSGII